MERRSNLKEFILGLTTDQRYWLVGGRRLPMLAGGAPEDEGGDGTGGTGGDGGSGAGGADGGTPEGGAGQPEGGGEGGEGAPSPAKQKADREYRLRQDKRALEEQLTEANKRLEAIEDRDKSELELATKRAKKAEERTTTLEKTVWRQAVQLEFLKASSAEKVRWIDAEDALVLAEKELVGLKVGDDGEVDEGEVKRVVRALAKTKPHLVQRAAPAPSGGNVGGNAHGQPVDDSKELARLYPALRTRTPGG